MRKMSEWEKAVRSHSHGANSHRRKKKSVSGLESEGGEGGCKTEVELEKAQKTNGREVTVSKVLEENRHSGCKGMISVVPPQN